MSAAEAVKRKFRVGQVVGAKDGSYGELVTPHAARPLQCSGRGSYTLFNNEGYVYVRGAKEQWYHVSELRPLTKRERGK